MKAKQILGVALIAAGLAAGPAAAAADLYVHVRVHGDKGEEVMLNLPVSMVKSLSGMIPDDAARNGRVRVHDKDYDVADLRRAWRELQNGPDTTYLTVNDPDSKVRIAKRGDYLELRATERNGKRESVEAKVPLAVMGALLSGSGNDLNVEAALQELARSGKGELLTVNSDDETVRIWVDRSAEGR